MIRSVAVIVWALTLSLPQLSRATAERYAEVMQAKAIEHGWDPFTYVALITYESRGNAVAEGDCKGGACRAIGLGQIWAMYLPGCRDDENPDTDPDRDCLQEREKLRDGAYNLRVLAGQLARQREYCKRRTGKSELWNALASQAGLNHPRINGAVCGMRQNKRGQWIRIKFSAQTERGLNRVINHRRMLIRQLERRSRSR